MDKAPLRLSGSPTTYEPGARVKRTRREPNEKDPLLQSEYQSYQLALEGTAATPVPFSDFVRHRETFVFDESSGMFDGMLDGA